MSLAGQGALGVWHSIEPGREAEVEDWYVNEHYHDRVVIDGFLRARGYRNLESGGSMYFSRYDAEDVSALSCDAYLHSLRNPSPWSQSIFPSYIGTKRGAFSVSYRWGIGIGGYLLSLRLEDGEGGIPDDIVAEIENVLTALKEIKGVIAVECWLVDVGATTIKTTEQEIRGKQDRYPAGAVLIDLMNSEAAQDVLRKLPLLNAHATRDLMKLTYQLTKDELILPRPH